MHIVMNTYIHISDAYMEVNGGDERLQIDGDIDLNEHMHDTGAKAVVIEPDGTYSTMV